MSITYSRTIPGLRTNRAIRRRALQGIQDLLAHLESFGVWLEILTVDRAAETITVQLSGEIPAAQRAHLGLEDGP